MNVQRLAGPVRALALASLLCAVPGAGFAAGNINFLLGAKSLDNNDWGDFDSQAAFGVSMSFQGENWPVWIAVDLLGSVEEQTVPLLGFGVDVSTGEVGVGVRKIWERGKARPFVGGGLAQIHAEMDFGILGTYDDDAVGLWLDGGCFWRLGRRFNIGVEARASSADVTLQDVKRDAGGFTLGLTLGWGW